MAFAWLKRKSSPNYLHQFSRAALDETRFTPDIAKLELSQFQRVFVYGETMRGHRSHGPMLPSEVAEYDSTCFTDQYFVMWKKRAGQASYPIAMENTGTWPTPQWDTPERARIQGELYVVASGHIPQLDIYHQNGLEFIRKRVTILRPHFSVVRIKEKDSYKARGIVSHQRGCTQIQAWMYVGVEDFWSGQLARFFSPLTTYTSEANPWLREYYAFTSMEVHR